jgi:peptidoglycan/LPS O-acetylase OafA/YrhL
MELIEGGIPLPPRLISHRSRSWDNRRVRTKTRAVVDLVPLGVFVLAAALIAFAARVTAPPYFGTDPAVVASLGVGALATAAVGHATWRNDRAVGVAIVLAAWTVAAYLFVLGLADSRSERRGQAGGWWTYSTPDDVCRHRIGCPRSLRGAGQPAGRWSSRSLSL